jgi:hypothetical protein
MYASLSKQILEMACFKWAEDEKHTCLQHYVIHSPVETAKWTVHPQVEHIRMM